MEEGKGEGHVREAHLSTVHCGHSATHTHGGERERQRERERVLYCYDMATYTVLYLCEFSHLCKNSVNFGHHLGLYNYFTDIV